MITAEEFWNEQLPMKNISDAMIEFAQMHVEEALKEASYNAVLASYDNNANKPGKSAFKTITIHGIEWQPCSKSILNAYPLTLIK